MKLPTSAQAVILRDLMKEGAFLGSSALSDGRFLLSVPSQERIHPLNRFIRSDTVLILDRNNWIAPYATGAQYKARNGVIVYDSAVPWYQTRYRITGEGRIVLAIYNARKAGYSE